jgi:ADP-heptose:LPS heptosyltransferase
MEFANYLGIQDEQIIWEIAGSPDRPGFLPEAYIVLNIGATKPANKWTVPGFVSLAEQVNKQLGMACVVTGGKEDMPMAGDIEAAASVNLVNLAGRTTIDELKDVLQHGKAVVTCDTGPMHLAVALGTEVIALFGPSDHHRTGPFRGHVIRKPAHCAPCNKKICSDPVCMTAITSEDVVKRLAAVLNAS